MPTARMRRSLAVAVLGAAALAGPPAAAQAASLPTVRSGEPPGPPLLHRPAPTAPELSVRAPFRARPLLVSGVDAYRRGEYLYQDYLFDDRGADTVPLSGNRSEPGSDIASPTAGDVFYPTGARYGGNAADIVELRVRPTPEAIVYRVTLATVKDDDAAVVGIGIDTDRSGGAAVAWPRGAGLSSPGLDAFVTAWGTGGELSVRPDGGDALSVTERLGRGAVTIDRRTNQMTIRVPRSLPRMEPGGATWRLVAGAGLWSGSGFKPVPARARPTEDEPASGDPTEDAPGVFNLAFRFDEPQASSPLTREQAIQPLDQLVASLRGGNLPLVPPYETFPGVGNWFEDKQARALKARTSGDFHADVDFARLAAGPAGTVHGPRREQARILASRLSVPEGVHEGFPAYGGRLQPYLLTVPTTYRRARPAGLTFALHSLGGTYTQYAVFSPRQLDQLGEQRGSLVATPLARGTDGWYTDEAEVDVFEVWADVARRFALDPDSVALTGYSMGGYGTYKLGTEYPDLFGRAFTAVGPPAREVWVPPDDPRMVSEGNRPNASSNTNPKLENARWVPFMNWVEVADQLVPYTGPRAQQARFDALGLRSTLWSFSPGEHFTLAVLDEWGPARDFLGRARVRRDPWRVNYAFLPAADRPALGLRHDHAYWVSDLRVRDGSGNPDTDPARGEIDARSLAFGEDDPRTAPARGAFPGPPTPAVIEGTDWTAIPRQARRNALRVVLDNVGRATLDGRRARLSGRRDVRVTVRSDGSGRMRLNLPLPAGAVVRRIEGGPVRGAARARAAQAPAPEVDLDRRGASFRVDSGERTYLITVPRSSQRGPADPLFTG